MPLPVAQLGYIPNVHVPQTSQRFLPQNPWEQLAMQVLGAAVSKGVGNIMTPDVTSQAQAAGLPVQGQANPWYKRALFGSNLTPEQLQRLTEQDMAQKNARELALQKIMSDEHLTSMTTTAADERAARGEAAATERTRITETGAENRQRSANLSHAVGVNKQIEAQTNLEKQKSQADIDLIVKKHELGKTLDPNEMLKLAGHLYDKANDQLALDAIKQEKPFTPLPRSELKRIYAELMATQTTPQSDSPSSWLQQTVPSGVPRYSPQRGAGSPPPPLSAKPTGPAFVPNQLSLIKMLQDALGSGTPATPTSTVPLSNAPFATPNLSETLAKNQVVSPMDLGQDAMYNLILAAMKMKDLPNTTTNAATEWLRQR